MNKKKIAIGALGALILTGSGVSLAAANNSEHARAEVSHSSSAEISALTLTGAMNVSALAHAKAADDADSDLATQPAEVTPPTASVDEESSLKVESENSVKVDNENSVTVDNENSDDADDESSDSLDLNLDLSVGGSDE